MKCLSVGGGPIPPYVPGVTEGSYEQGIGLNNIGLLVRIAGKVTKVIGNYLYVDDGSDIQDIWDFNGFRTGVLVQYVATPPVSEGNFVIVTGVVEGSIPAGWTANRRFIRCRIPADLIKVYP